MGEFIAGAIAQTTSFGELLPGGARRWLGVLLAILALTHPQVVADGFELAWRAEAEAATHVLNDTLAPVLTANVVWSP